MAPAKNKLINVVYDRDEFQIVFGRIRECNLFVYVSGVGELKDWGKLKIDVGSLLGLSRLLLMKFTTGAVYQGTLSEK